MATSMTNKLAVGIGAAGALAAIVTTTVTPAFGSTSAASASIRISRNNGPVTLKNGDTTLVKFKLAAGRWLITGKMWADSVPGQPTNNTVVGCHLANGSTALDSSAFNIPKIGGSSAGVNIDSAVITLTSPATISLQCNDFGSQAVAHEAVLTAVG